jgi:hypothetical protein
VLDLGPFGLGGCSAAQAVIENDRAAIVSSLITLEFSLEAIMFIRGNRRDRIIQTRGGPVA